MTRLPIRKSISNPSSLEWSQKNRVNIEFRQLEQSVDDHNSPVFIYQILLEGVEGCSGKGYSKKESQQQACKETLQRLRREPQFIDAVFAAKGERTKMEEEPVSVPEEFSDAAPEIVVSQKTDTKGPKSELAAADEFSLDDISATPREKTREEIIAEAEDAAFAGI